MIRYRPQNQLSLEGFETPFERKLDPENRWVKLAQLLPWDEMAEIYHKSLSTDQGRPSLDARLVIGSMIIKHRLNLSDREVVWTLQENIYLQYFVGFSSFQTEKAFDASLFVQMRKRMGADKFDEMNCRIIEKAKGLPKQAGKDKEQNDDEDSKKGGKVEEEKPSGEDCEISVRNKGQLKLDATVADQLIVYPTDLGLLNQAREESERLIDLLYKQSDRWIKPRTYRRIARKQYLGLSKKRRKTKKEIRKGIGQQLGYLKRNLSHVEKLLDELPAEPFPLTFRDLKIYWVIQQLYDQQKFMYDNKVKSHPHRIVNIYQAYVRPIPRGKDKTRIEFGAKLGASEFDGFTRLDHISWEAYHEASNLIPQVESYKKLHGYYPELVLVDKIYLTRENRKWLKSKGIRHVGKPLGRPKPLSRYQKRKLRKERNSRNHIEGKFGQGKNAYDLGRIRARRQDTSQSWIAAIFMVMNLVRWLKITPVLLWWLTQLVYWVIVFLSPKASSLKVPDRLRINLASIKTQN